MRMLSPPRRLLAQPEFDLALYDRPEHVADYLLNPPLVQLTQEWAALAAQGRLPGRADFPPEKLRYMLGNLVLTDIVEGEAAGPLPAGLKANMRYRLFGSNFVYQRGYDLTGKLLTDHPDPALVQQGLVACQVLMQRRLPTLGRIVGLDAAGSPVLTESLLLPLADDGVTVNRVLGGQFNQPMDEALRARRDQARLLYGDPDILRLLVRHADLRRLLADWESWRGKRCMPARADFQPEDLRYLLGNLFLLDVVPQADGLPRLRYRLFGSAVARYRGYDLTGRFLDQHPDASFAAAASQAYAPVLAARRPLWADVNGRSAAGLLFGFEALVLPLSSDGENVDMVLAAQILP